MTKTLRNLQNREDGFTLLELLIVVLIVGILAAIAIPVYLGIQAGAHKSAVRSDVNIKVKTIQASLTEGAKVTDFLGTTNGTETGETIQVKASTTTGAAANDFMVIGSESTTGSPAAAINYTYTYDSVTGNFTNSDTTNVALGGSNAPATALFLDFEGNTENFVFNGSNSVVTSSTDYANTGTYSFKCTATGSNYCFYTRNLTELTPGTSYTVTGYMRTSNTATPTIGLYRNASGYLSNDTYSSVGTWRQFTLTFTYQSGDVLRLVSGTNQIVYLDTIKFNSN